MEVAWCAHWPCCIIWTLTKRLINNFFTLLPLLYDLVNRETAVTEAFPVFVGVASCCTVHQRFFFFFKWRPVRKCLFPCCCCCCCCLAFLWRPIGMRSLVAAVCVKIESNQGSGAWSRFIWLPTAFSVSIYLPCLLSSSPCSLSFYLTPTGLEVWATY